MLYRNLRDFIDKSAKPLSRGPVAIILVEDLVEVETTIRHHLHLGFQEIVVLSPDELQLPAELEKSIHRIRCDLSRENAGTDAINRLIAAAPNIWFYYCFNAEFLFYPFCETRSVGEMLTFNTEERRDTILTYVIDLYAGDLNEYPNAVSLENAHLDKSGYYAQARLSPDTTHPLERQLDFFGGLRWRFEEHISAKRRKIDRVAMFRTKPGLRLLPNHTFNDPEYNTYACPWHHNITAAICSFRTAKALKTNPGSTFEIDSFHWHNSTGFEWNSQQLLDLGLMEPGQWF